jgi:hypothetical protein
VTEFVAVDGEAVSDSYVLLASSTGQSVEDFAGLSSGACLEFLLGLAAPRRRLICFGLNYDVNQWLAGVPKPNLRELWASGFCIWRSYRLRWLPRRWFSITHLDGRKVRISEVWGFFQASFIGALESWEIPVAEEIVEGKRDRALFSEADARSGRMRAYCLRECSELVTLCERLRAATIEADCEPRDWIGAGALAGAMLKARGLAAYHVHDSDLTSSENALEAIMRAYFGGRVEALRIGSYANVESVDVRSAYPHAATSLPNLAGARLKARRRYDPTAEHGIWRVRWRNLEGLLMPFPVRNKRAIYYPRTGEGYYHACEVAAALAAGFELDIGHGWTLEVGSPGPPAKGELPFSWVPEAFALRARWKAEGNAAEKALKLGLNSLYGKLAQGIGYRGGPPRWQSYLWAGEITARTRARMLELAAASRDPIAIATDGLYARSCSGRTGRRLGDLERAEHDSLFVAQPGLYAAESGGVVTVRSRGHFASEIDYAELREGFQAEGFEHVHHYHSRRFIGLGSALMRRDLRLWRHWPDERRSISLYPTRKVPGEGGVLLPADGRGLDPSEPYVPKGSLTDTAELENVQAAEQPMRSD